MSATCPTHLILRDLIIIFGEDTNLNKKFWEELIAYVPFIRRLQQFLVTGTCLPSRCLVTIGGYTDTPTDFPLIRHWPHWKRRVQQSHIFACIRCLGNVFTKPLPSNNGGMHIQTYRLMGGHLWSTPLRRAQVPWCTYVPSFIKIGLGIQKLIRGIHIETHSKVFS
jgi:hypothetical protein